MGYVVCIQRQRIFHETIVLYPPIVWFMSFVVNDSAVFHETIVLYPPIVWFMSFASNGSADSREPIVLCPPIVRAMSFVSNDSAVFQPGYEAACELGTWMGDASCISLVGSSR